MGFGHSYHRFFLMLKQQSRQGNDTVGMVLFCHNQTHTLLTKALMTAGSLKYQNGNSGKNITLKIIETSRSSKHRNDYPNLFTLSNTGKLS